MSPPAGWTMPHASNPLMCPLSRDSFTPACDRVARPAVVGGPRQRVRQHGIRRLNFLKRGRGARTRAIGVPLQGEPAPGAASFSAPDSVIEA